MKYSLLVVTGALFIVADAYKMSRCELVQQLRHQQFPEEKLRDWVCLVERHSSRRTDLISAMSKKGFREYGLFQLSDRFWCSNNNTPGKDCNVTCADLLTDDITKASKCAKTVYSRHRFGAWYGWGSSCQASLPDISSC